MAPVTITSDLGTRDFYLAALKGAIIAHCEGTPPMLVDITHSIRPFDLKEAAFAIKNSYHYFPKGSIHIVHIGSGDGNRRVLLSIIDGHYFLTFDTGLLSLAFEKTPHETYQLNDEFLENSSLLYETALAKAVNLLLNEYKPTDFAHLAVETVNYRLLQPVTKPGSIRGTVVYIDNYGNAVTNITRKMFDEYIGEKRFTIAANVGTANSVSVRYGDAEEGEMVCLFGSTGFLEVAINKGKAENLLGLKVESPVLVFAE